MKDAKDLIPWTVTDISVNPYGPEFWSMNPSVHLDTDGTLRCVARITDYCMPNGVTKRSSKARASGTITRNAMLILDPDSLKIARIHKMDERDGQPRVLSCANVGYEDMRLFKTDQFGLQGVAASLHLGRGKMDVGRPEGATQNQIPEQVIVSFDDEYNIVHVRPIRGQHSFKAQKNWAPFDHAESPRFLYAIDRGTMFDEHGAIEGPAIVTPSSSRILRHDNADPNERERAEREERERREHEERERAEREERERREHEDRERDKRELEEREKREREKATRRPPPQRGAEVKVVRGRTVAIDAMLHRPTSRYGAHPSAQKASGRHIDNSTQSGRINVAAGRALPQRYAGLRGGSQLIHVGDNRWLGIGHEMNFTGGGPGAAGRKYYYHTWFLTDARGKMISASEPMKLAQNGIEFAAGMAIDGDRVVVSFGTDDMNCHLGVTSLSAVLGTLNAVEQ